MRAWRDELTGAFCEHAEFVEASTGGASRGPFRQQDPVRFCQGLFGQIGQRPSDSEDFGLGFVAAATEPHADLMRVVSGL